MKREYTNLNAIIVSDIHVPYIDMKAFERLKSDLKTKKPELLILNGDIIDFYQLSRFSKNPERLLQLQKDINMCVKVLTELRNIMGDKEIIFISGNHEARLQNFLEDNPELYSLDSLKLTNLLHLDKLKIQYVQNNTKDSFITINGINIGHFNVARKHAGISAMSLVVEKMGSYIQGHCHRLAAGYKRTDKGTLIAAESGCLCDLNPDYCFKPDWCHGYIELNIVKKKASVVSVRL